MYVPTAEPAEPLIRVCCKGQRERRGEQDPSWAACKCTRLSRAAPLCPGRRGGRALAQWKEGHAAVPAMLPINTCS